MRHLALVLILVCGWGQCATALTIYRIGGANLPAPELDVPYEFVQLDWADADPNFHGEIDQLAVNTDFITPQRLDPGTNLTPLIEGELGGEIRILEWTGWQVRQVEDVAVFDQDAETAYLGDGHYLRAPGYGPQKKYWLFDLGGRFLLDRIHLFPREEFKSHRFIENFLIGINDGDPLKDGTRDYRVLWTFGNNLRNTGFDFDIVHNISENTQPDLDLKIPAVPVRYLLFEGPENTRGIWEIAEFEIYGAGPAPFAGYVSNVIDLGAPASIGEFTWGGSKDPEANIDFRVRAGGDDDPNNYWRLTFRGDERSHFGRDGKALNLRSYGGLESGEKAGVTHDTEHWGFWTTAFGFDVGRADIAVSKPRQFIQVRADFESTDKASGQLDYLQFAVSIPPVASATLAEITPMAAPAGEAASFTYKIKPRLQPGDLGFDSISIDTPVRALGVDAVRIGGIDAAFTVVELAEVGFTVRIPAVDTQLTEELIEVDFRGEVFKFGTVFTGRVFNSEMPHEVHQSLTPGDADPLVDSDRLQVDLLDLHHSTIQALRLSSRVLTPNGDGVNDRIEIEYDLLNLSGGVPVRVEIYDLAGRSLGRVLQSTADSGRAMMQWSGRAGNGSVLVPGMYILRFEVEADSGMDVIERVVTIAY